MQGVLVADRDGRIRLATAAELIGRRLADVLPSTASGTVGVTVVDDHGAPIGTTIAASDVDPTLASRIAEDVRYLLQGAEPGRVLDLHRVADEVVAKLQLAAPPRVGIELARDGQPLLVTMHEPRLEHVLIELMLNAIDAIPATGRVMLAVRRDDVRRLAIVEVIDTGTGISGPVLPHIFEPLFTTKVRGTGLGLAVARAIVEGYGGALVVSTKLGIGTTFTLDLPMPAPR